MNETVQQTDSGIELVSLVLGPPWAKDDDNSGSS